MSVSIYLQAKTLDPDKKNRINDCIENLETGYYSSNFSMFLLREFEGSEFDQIQELLSIDLSRLRLHPENVYGTSDQLNYELYLAKQEQDKVKDIEQKQVLHEKVWRKTYYYNNKDWTRIEKMEELIETFIEKLASHKNNMPELKPIEQDWPFGRLNYFEYPKDQRQICIINDLKVILDRLGCMKKENIEYVCFTY